MEQPIEDGSPVERREPSLMRRGLLAFEPGTGGLHEEWLHRTIELEIVPRLILAHRRAGAGAPGASAEQTLCPGSADVEALTNLILQDDSPACTLFVDRLRDRGVALEALFLELLAPAARRLGDLWERDQCDFTQVTLGLWRLQNLLFELSPDLPEFLVDPAGGPRRAMLTSAPGSQHTLGLLMVAEFFRRAGWDVWSEQSATPDELADVARSDWFDLIGVSTSTDAQISAVTALIRSLRKASRNAGVGMMVGGPIFVARPELVSVVGADFTAIDARQAVAAAEAFAAGKPGRC